MMNRDEWLKIYVKEIEKAAGQAPALGEGADERERRAALIRSNLLLVVKLAQEQRTLCEVPLLDLIAAGNIGLVKAGTKFDPEKEGAFAVFAGWWIRQSIRREVTKKFAECFAPMKPDMGCDEDLALPA
ncbi:sigma factor [Prosthecobacter sp.]|uniref:sigma factor n=1 Tax=Prosthecobacter sp. TaxID=1965333 RepID=UPI003783123B